jgi:glutamine amidotransferase
LSRSDVIGVLDYGVGNLGSVLNMLRHIDVKATTIRTPDQLTKVTKLLLPGVGSFDHAIEKLDALDLAEPIRGYARSGGTILGICLGMQLLLDSSEEGQRQGLGLIPGRSKRFSFAPEAKRRVPHMGWNTVTPRAENPLLAGLESDNRFYFVHSYRAVCENDTDIVGETEYGEMFPSMIGRGNVFGAQFHPEKSHRYGMDLLRNFAGFRA